jgi:hypothetical protein
MPTLLSLETNGANRADVECQVESSLGFVELPLSRAANFPPDQYRFCIATNVRSIILACRYVAQRGESVA